MHSETGQTPHERYHQEPRLMRQVDLGAVLGFFHQEVLRIVRQGLLGRACGEPVLRRRSGAAGRSGGRPVRSLLVRWTKSSFTRPWALYRGPRPALPAGKGKPSPTVARAACRAHRAPLSRRPAGRARRHAGTTTQPGHRLPFGTAEERVVRVEFRPRFRPLLGSSRAACPG